MINVTIYDKGGKIYRKYTEDTLITLYANSPLGANYELSVLVEGTVFMALLTYYAMRAEEVSYFEYVSQKYKPTLGGAIKKLKGFNIFKNTVITELNKYKELRNDFIHDPFHMKSMNFNNQSILEALETLFHQGINVLNILSPLVYPGSPNIEEWKKRYKATIEGSVININLGKIQEELNKRKAMNKKE